ncbi:hypothetical protein PanWU01x14_104990, partial [Parasponia andersonii]
MPKLHVTWTRATCHLKEDYLLLELCYIPSGHLFLLEQAAYDSRRLQNLLTWALRACSS